jgi:O-antigen/teichoic acid export membrane protein
MGKFERNTIANLGGTIWSVLLGLVCVPLLIRFLGAEAFGLVGLFLTLQSIFAFLDLGIGATLNREIARLSATAAEAGEPRDLVFTLQAIYWIAAVVIAIATVVFAPFIAGVWLKPHSLPVATVTMCVRMMGIAIALQFPFVFYQCGMLGLQRHVLLNTLSGVVAALRSAGILLLVAFVSRTPEMYFGGQIVVSAGATAAAAVLLWRILPSSGGRASRFRRDLLQRVWRFGTAWTVNSLATLALLQGDRIVLSTVLPLEMFGWYALAQRLAAGLYAIIIAVDGVIFPHFSGAVATGDEREIAHVYHRGAQVMAVLLVPAAVVTAFFSREVLTLLTRDAAVVRNAHVVLTLLAAGMLLHGLFQAPYYMQLAYGRWRLISITNAVLVATILPLYVVGGKSFGAAGAAAVFVLLNLAWAVTMPWMHRRFLRGEQRRWLVHDVSLPLAGALGAAVVVFFIPAHGTGVLQLLLFLAAAGLVTLATTAALAPDIRSFIAPYLRRAATPEAV